MSDLTDVKLFLASLIRPIVKEAVREEFNSFSGSQPTPDHIGGLELAEELTRLSRSRIYELVSKRAIPHSKKGNRLTFQRDQLLAWLAEGYREQKGGQDA